MKKAYLFGHVGSMNRGCEAIVRSTTEILKNSGFSSVNLMANNFDYDKKLSLDKCVNFLPHKNHNFFMKVIRRLSWKYLKNITPHILCDISEFKFINKDDFLFNIGGDTYCYDYPYYLVSQNRAAKALNLKSIFWGCSIDERVLQNPKLIDDINRYSYIITRESLSYQIFMKILKDPEKLFLACDPAFNLKIRETPLPNGFVEKNTVGINVSPLFFSNYTDPSDIMRKNIRTLINFILTETDMNICLIPHVYDVDKNLHDIAVIKEIFAEYKEDCRVCIVEENLSCEQLKYIISKCRLFVGARTHSMIAAYSTGVPALALSYSVKSRGIAKDLYGDEDLVIQYKNIKESDEIKNAFKLLLQRENDINLIYSLKLDDYKKSIYQVTEKIISKIDNV